MKIKLLILCTIICISAIACIAQNEKQNGNLAAFISDEVVKLGGKTNKLAEKSLSGEWVVRRDEFGAAIDVFNGDYDSITNVLTAEFGSPHLYIKPKEDRKATYAYPRKNAGVNIFVKEEKAFIEITITKPL